MGPERKAALTLADMRGKLQAEAEFTFEERVFGATEKGF
jgi:hypothetical protein